MVGSAMSEMPTARCSLGNESTAREEDRLHPRPGGHFDAQCAPPRAPTCNRKAIPKEWEAGGGDAHHVNTSAGRALEVSSGGVQANARGVATIAGLLANGGAYSAAAARAARLMLVCRQ